MHTPPPQACTPAVDMPVKPAGRGDDRIQHGHADEKADGQVSMCKVAAHMLPPLGTTMQPCPLTCLSCLQNGAMTEYSKGLGWVGGTEGQMRMCQVAPDESTWTVWQQGQALRGNQDSLH